MVSIINHSQKNCGRPRDTFPPCPPRIRAQSICEVSETNDFKTPKNFLHWKYDFTQCDSDVVKFRVYFRSHRGKEFKYVDSASGAFTRELTDQRDTLHYSLAGCYAMSSVDSFGNESDLSNFVCVDNCPKYELPNLFTPNGDGYNDVFRPMPGWRFVKSIHFKVYNRWGQLVFQTTDPRINWNGRDMNSGEKLAPGTYYYSIVIYKLFLNNTTSEKRKGIIQIAR